MKYFYSLAFLLFFQCVHGTETRIQTLLNVNNEVLFQQDLPTSWRMQSYNVLSFNNAIQIHLASVIEVLRSHDVHHLSPKQKLNRSSLMNCLEKYAIQGKFPVNDYLSVQNPVFIDRFATHCAVGYLMQQSGFEQLAREIQSTQNFAFVRQINHPGVLEWAMNNGFTVDELAWIQPGYPPNTVVSPLLGGVNGVVNDIYLYNGELIAAGNFSQADGQPANNIASYISGFAGFLWIETFGGTNGPVNALDMFNQQLIAAGEFSMAGTTSVNNIARLGNDGWEAMGSGIFGKVNDLEWHEGELYAAGDFEFIGGGPANADIAVWSGSEWMPLGWGTNGSINALRSSADGLLFAGDFTEAGNASMRNVGKFLNDIPEPLGIGISSVVYDVELWNNTPVIAADLKNQSEVCGLMQFNSGSWVSLPGIAEMASADSLGSVRSLMIANNELFAGGDFSGIELMTFGENLVKWSSMNVYPNSIAVFDSTVLCLENMQETILAGGHFTQHLGSQINHIASLNNVLTAENSLPLTTEIAIFPNPCNGQFTIKNLGYQQQFKLFTIEGKFLDSFHVTDSKKIMLPSAGMYLLKSENGDFFKIVSQ